MPKITVDIPQESKSFLTDYIMFEDAAKNLSEAIHWCIDSCMKIEKKYGVDACYVAYNDIVAQKATSFGEFAANNYHRGDGKYYTYEYEKAKDGPHLIQGKELTFLTSEALYKWWDENIYNK